MPPACLNYELRCVGLVELEFNADALETWADEGRSTLLQVLAPRSVVCAGSPLCACAALFWQLNLHMHYAELLPRVKSGQVKVFHWRLKHACAKVGQEGQEKMSQ